LTSPYPAFGQGEIEISQFSMGLFMNAVIIHDLPKWQVTSHGNGLAYELFNKQSDFGIFFQGDDAEIFRDSLRALTESLRAPLDYSDALGCIWSDYSECAVHWGERA